MLKTLGLVMIIGLLPALSYAQDVFDEKFVGYKMDPFVLQESQECLLKPYVPSFGGTFDIMRGAVYNVDKATGTTK